MTEQNTPTNKSAFFRIILVVAFMLLIASLIFNVVTAIRLKNTKADLEAEKKNVYKNNAVKDANRQAIDNRAGYRDSLMREVAKSNAEKILKEQELKQIKEKYEQLYDKINSIDNIGDHMRMGDSMVSEWNKRYPRLR